MTRTHRTVALLAVWAPIMAACPPPYEEPTTTEAATGTETTGSGTTTSTTNPTTGPDTTGEPTSGPDTTTTGPMTSGTTDNTTGDPGCADDAACKAQDPNTPFCVDKVCVDCKGTADPDTACAGLDPALPVCNQDSGQCVVCTADNKQLCTGETPVCDAAVNECVGCSEHADCPDTACNQESGACFGPEYVIWVDVAAQCDIGDGTMAMPFCQIAQALDKVAMNNPSVGWTIKIKAGNYIQPTLAVPEGALLAIIGEGGVAKLKGTTAATLQVGVNTKLHLGKINLSSNADDTGLVCAGAQIFGDDVVFASNRQGYVGTDCSANFKRTVFYKNTSGALTAIGAGTTWVTNSYVSNNGSNAESTYGGLLTGQGQELHLVYSTVLNNLSETGARSLQCTVDAGPTEVRNSVVIAFVSPSIDCAGATIEHSAIDDGKMEGDTNLQAVMADAMNWFDPQVAGIYKAKPDTPLKELAMWNDGDPKADFNGDPRPATMGSADYAGADRPAM